MNGWPYLSLDGEREWPMPTRISNSVQENLITLLQMDDQHGRLVANLVDVELFEGEYRIVAQRFLTYWKRYGVAPKAHAIDLFADIIDTPNKKAKAFRGIILSAIQLYESGLNTGYVMQQLQLFMRQQKLKQSILKASEMLSRAQDQEAVEEVEATLSDLLRSRDFAFDPGTRLDDIDGLLDYLATARDEFPTGITVLDRRRVVPARGTIMLFLAGKGRGKSWFLVNCGKHSLIHRKRVLHLSLENDAEEVKLRYWQAFHAIAKQPIESVDVLTFRERQDPDADFSDRVRLSHVPVGFSLATHDARLELESRMERMQMWSENLRIKRFPNRMLTPDALRGFLDSLESTQNFIPDILLLDYAKLMKISMRDYRHSVGENMEQLRAIAVERNLALVTVDQFNRAGYDAKQGKSTNIGEDWSQVHTADIVMSFSATDEERKRGLGRIYVDHCRTEDDKFAFMLSQNYAIGQFCIQSMALPKGYKVDGLDDLGLDDEDDEDSNDGQQRDFNG